MKSIHGGNLDIVVYTDEIWVNDNHFGWHYESFFCNSKEQAIIKANMFWPEAARIELVS